MFKRIQFLFILFLCSTGFSAIAQKFLTNRQIYNFDIGDIFEYQISYYLYSNIIHQRLTVISRRMSIGDDSIFYTMQSRSFFASGPSNIQNNTDTIIVSYTNLDSIWQTPVYVHNNADSFSWAIDTLNGRIKNKYFYISPNPHLGPSEYKRVGKEWGEGIGQISIGEGDDSGPSGWYTDLVYYKKKNEVYGNSFFSGISQAFNLSQNIKLFPNPVKRGNSLTISGLDLGQKELNIIDMTGRVVFSSLVNCSEFSLALKDFSSGVYFFRMNIDNETFAQKFVILP